MSERTVKLSELVGENLLEIGAGRPRSVDLDRYPLPILKVADVLDGKIESSFQDYVSEACEQVMGLKISMPGDIVLTTKGTVGRVAIMPAEGPRFAYSPQLCYFRPDANGPLKPRYMYYWFKSVDFWKQADALKGQTDMADFLSLGDIYSLKLRLPSLAQQASVVDILGALDDKIAVNE
ncbi:restriction endonuclease subunit S, partial [Streptomyces microflavus]